MAMFVFRCDASRSIGLGHLMRCVAVAQAARRRDCDVHFFTRPTDIARAVLQGYGFAASEVTPRSVGFLDVLSPSDTLVIDGYEMGAVSRAAAELGIVTAQYDDHGRGSYPTRLVINQNLPVTHEIEAPNGEILVGPAYAAIRDEIREYRTRRRPDIGSRLLIMMGSSDLKKLTGPLCKLAAESGSFREIIAVVGPSATDDGLPPTVSVVRAPKDPGVIMASASAALSAAGTTTWELMCLGVPTALIQTSEDQVHVATPLARAGAALQIEDPHSRGEVSSVLSSLASRAMASSLSTRAQELVDGRGADRVVDRLLAAHEDTPPSVWSDRL